MPPEFTQKELTEKFQKLPEDLKEAIFSVDTAETIIKTGKKYKLLIDKIGELASETGRVLLGITHPKDFVGNLARRLGVDSQTARNIAEDVNKEIFSKVRENLKKVHGIEEEKIAEKPPQNEKATQYPAPTPVPEPEIKTQTPEINPMAEIKPSEMKPQPEKTIDLASGIQGKTAIPETKKPAIEKSYVPAAEQTPTESPEKIPPIFAPKENEIIMGRPPAFSDKSGIADGNDKTGEKSLFEKLKGSKEDAHKGRDPYREPLE